jgi:putative transposase
MHFEQGHIYHIYNQGNNRQRIFFERDNYLFFLRKMREYLLPYGDILAWCLMPNHFHWMVAVKAVEIDVAAVGAVTDGVTSSHPVSKLRILNDSIAILLRSYTRAINKQTGRSGNLFREASKAECLTKLEGITPSFYNTSTGTQISTHYLEEQYPQICFEYIHQNPVKASLVKNAEDWEFSSYRDYYGDRKGTLANKEAAQKYISI